MAGDGLTRTQKRAIAGLLEATTVEQAADIAGCSESSIYRWQREDEAFQMELAKAEGAMIAQAVAGCVADMTQNHETMRAIRDDTDAKAAVRLQAAQALDRSLLKWRELRNVEERLAKLEGVFLGEYR